MRNFLILISVLFLAFFIYSCTSTGEKLITFEENGGTEVEDVRVSTSSTSINLPESTKEGFTFDGWYLDESLTQSFSITDLLTQTTIKLYAKWAINEYTISFENDGGIAIEPITQDYDTTVLEPADPTKEGYRFVGWFSDEALSVPYIFSTMPAEDITVYAKWSAVLIEDDPTDYTFNLLDNDTYEVTGYIGLNKTLVIPSSYLGKAVTSIGDEVFFECASLTSVFIPSSVTNIGEGAFAGCASLTNITIPSSVTNIGEGAFAGCSSLTDIIVEDGNLNYSSQDGVLFDKLKLTLIRYPAGKTDEIYTIPSSVTTIGNRAFFLCSSITSITIPSSVTSIEDGAFAICTSLISITIPSSVTSIGDDAFIYCTNLKSIIIPSSVTSIGEGVFIFCNELTIYAETESQPAGWHEDWNYFHSPVVWGYVIGSESTISFDTMGGTLVGPITQNAGTTIVLPEDPTKDGYVFDGWYTEVELINEYTFTTMPIEDITLYSKWIEQGTITQDEMVFVILGNEATLIEYNGTNTVIVIPSTISGANVVAIGDGVFSWKYVVSVTIPHTVVSIGDQAFTFTYYLESIIFEANSQLQHIGNEAFYETYYFTDLMTLPDSVISIGDRAFYKTGLKAINIPISVTNIGEDAFMNCRNLNIFIEATTIPTTWHSNWNPDNKPTFFGYLETIDDGSFIYATFSSNEANLIGISATNLGTNIVIPSSFGSYVVTSISMGAFRGDLQIISITIPSGVTEIRDYTFSASLIETVLFDIESQLSIIGKSAFSWCGYLKTIRLPETVTWIGYEAFEFAGHVLNKLEIVIPLSVEYIGQNAFSGSFFSKINVAAESRPAGWHASWNPDNITVVWDYLGIFIEYTVTFEDYDGSQIDVQLVNHGNSATPPSDPIREGYTFEGWDLPYNTITENITITAQYNINTYNLIYYEEDGTTVIQITIYEYDADLSEHELPEAPDKEGYTFDGWVSLPLNMPSSDVIRVATYTLDDVDILITMVSVGTIGTTYTVPKYVDDSETAEVDGGYFMAIYETTYELWYEVRIWAESNGYIFQNLGREGYDGIIGDVPTERKHEPVTYISWRDVIVWTNALSEMTGLDPVYRTTEDVIIKDSRYDNGNIVDAAVQTSNNGYRLPTYMEWEMAARWKNDTESINGSILVGGRYWTPGNYASGATTDYNNLVATQAVAWYRYDNSEVQTHTVGQKSSNHLGIYDMSGNVWEWNYSTGSYRYMRGGSYYHDAYTLQVGDEQHSYPDYGTTRNGFRLVRTPNITEKISLVSVGTLGVTYTIPTGTDDSGTAEVDGGYLMATTQTTYELWYEVRVWAETNGYYFQNLGREGTYGIIGAEPTEAKKEPVTKVSWRDVIVWINALSEMTGLDPVYRTASDEIIRDSRDANGSVVDAAIQTINKGYRLPTSMEWEMAARWKNDSESINGSIFVGGRYWTPGNYASGATGPAYDPIDEIATQAVAWYNANSGPRVQAVGQLIPNHLGIYDMSGNIWEWTDTFYGLRLIVRGGDCFNSTNYLLVGGVYPNNWMMANPDYNSYQPIGFRIVRNP